MPVFYELDAELLGEGHVWVDPALVSYTQVDIQLYFLYHYHCGLSLSGSSVEVNYNRGLLYHLLFYR